MKKFLFVLTKKQFSFKNPFSNIHFLFLKMLKQLFVLKECIRIFAWCICDTPGGPQDDDLIRTTRQWPRPPAHSPRSPLLRPTCLAFSFSCLTPCCYSPLPPPAFPFPPLFPTPAYSFSSHSPDPPTPRVAFPLSAPSPRSPRSPHHSRRPTPPSLFLLAPL